MATYSCTHPQFSFSDSLSFVRRELKRIPRVVRIGLRKLGLLEDLEQELHLAFFQTASLTNDFQEIARALHAAGERFRYREIVRRKEREVAEGFAGSAYHALVYGEAPEPDASE